MSNLSKIFFIVFGIVFLFIVFIVLFNSRKQKYISPISNILGISQQKYFPSPTITTFISSPTTLPSLSPTNQPSPTPIITPTSIPFPSPSPSPTITSTPSPIPTQISVEQYDKWFTDYSNHYSIDRSMLVKIAMCESELNPNAVNGEFGGLFQFTESTWRSTRNEMNMDHNPELRFNPEEAIKTTAYKISVDGITPWKNCVKQ